MRDSRSTGREIEPQEEPILIDLTNSDDEEEEKIEIRSFVKMMQEAFREVMVQELEKKFPVGYNINKN